MKCLNAYAGIGGNRKLWPHDVEVTAIEIDSNIAAIYQDFFPNDKVIVTDAHQYILEHFREYDFIWASPPCPTHSKVRKLSHPDLPVYPDMRLYEEIILLDNWFDGKWVIENVQGYYEPLIRPYKVGRHYVWSNFHIGGKDTEGMLVRDGNNEARQELFGFDLSKYQGIDKQKILRNCVHPNLGRFIFDQAFRGKQERLPE
jgi:DNA (cytosine-5)-methyltransferase 1